MRTTKRTTVDRETAMAEFERQDEEGLNANPLPSPSPEILKQLEARVPRGESTSGFLTDDRSDRDIREGLDLVSREAF